MAPPVAGSYGALAKMCYTKIDKCVLARKDRLQIGGKVRWNKSFTITHFYIFGVTLCPLCPPDMSKEVGVHLFYMGNTYSNSKMVQQHNMWLIKPYFYT